MQKDKAQKVAKIVKTDTLIDPNTVMIKFLHAVVTNSAVLGASGLWNFTSPAIGIFLKHNFIILIAINCPLELILGCVLIEAARINPTCHEVARVAETHNQGTNIAMPHTHSLVRYLWKSLFDVDEEASEGTDEVSDLDNWVRFEAYVFEDTFNCPYEVSATNASRR